MHFSQFMNYRSLSTRFPLPFPLHQSHPSPPNSLMRLLLSHKLDGVVLLAILAELLKKTLQLTHAVVALGRRRKVRRMDTQFINTYEKVG